MAGRTCRLLALYLAVLLALDFSTMTYAVLRGPFPLAVALGAPTAYLNIFVHVPIAISSYIVFALALVSGILYLWKRDDKYDRITQSAVIVGEAYGVFTIITGMAWASESWGAAWNWDPRETGVLLLVLAYLGYFAVRNSIPDPERKKLVANAYAVAAFSMVPISFAAPYIFKSLHPSFREAQTFMWTGSAAPLMGSRMLLAILTAISLVLAPYKARTAKCNTKTLVTIGAAFLIAAAAAATYVAAPYITDNPVRAVRVGTDENGNITWILLSNGTNTTLPKPVENPVKPPLTRQGQSSLTGHIITLENGKIQVVRHWCVPFNMAMYGLLVFTALLAQHLYTKNKTH